MLRPPTPTRTSLLRAGDVIVIDFPGAVGIKRRPVVVLSSDAYHASRPDIVVGLITSKTASSRADTDHLLDDWQDAGLRVPSAFRSFFATLPRATQSVRIGRLSDRDWQGVCSCVKTALAPLSPGPPPG